MGTYEYVVAQIDGDYAQLQRVDEPSGELKLVARALLPIGILQGKSLPRILRQSKYVTKRVTIQ